MISIHPLKILSAFGILLLAAYGCSSSSRMPAMKPERTFASRTMVFQQRSSQLLVSDGYYDATTNFPETPPDMDDVQMVTDGKDSWTLTLRLDFDGSKDTIPVVEQHPDTEEKILRNYITWHFDLVCLGRKGADAMFETRLSRKDLAQRVHNQGEFAYDLLLGNGYYVQVEGILNGGAILLGMEVAPGDACGGTQFLLALEKSGELRWIHPGNYFPYPGYDIQDKFSPDGKQYFSGSAFFTTQGPDTNWKQPNGYVLDALRLDDNLLLISWSDSAGNAEDATVQCLNWEKQVLASRHLSLISEGLGYQIGYHDSKRKRVIMYEDLIGKVYVFSYSGSPQFTSQPLSELRHYDNFPGKPWQEMIMSEAGKTDLAIDTASGEICAFERY